jgi:four helix bundle protein
VRKKTPNAQRRTPNIEFVRPRVAEVFNGEYESKRKPVNDLEDRLLDFAVSIVELTESFPLTRAGNHIAGQLLRCGTSPLSNHGEVEAAESRKDFVHKLRICLKELRETKRWLRFASRLKKFGHVADLPACLTEVDELIGIVGASIRTVERNAK